ncbi:MAG: YEATS-associated helix-containing protein [Terriglobia bacterium]
MTRYNIILLLAAMIASGVLGGAANYLLLHKDDPEYAKRSRSFVLGLVASLLVPLFLKTISSDMVDKISTIRYGSGIPFDFFVFASFCLLVAVFSRTFAETVAKRLVAEVEKAKRESQEAKTRAVQAEEKASQAEPVLRQEMEQRTEPLPESARSSIPPSLQDLPVDRTDRQLLGALLNGQYSYRTISSLADEVQVEEHDAVRRLEGMREYALIGKKATPTRNLWFLTDKGCNWLEAQAPGEELPRDSNVM